jgi:hypothetical protein
MRRSCNGARPASRAGCGESSAAGEQPASRWRGCSPSSRSRRTGERTRIGSECFGTNEGIPVRRLRKSGNEGRAVQQWSGADRRARRLAESCVDAGGCQYVSRQRSAHAGRLPNHQRKARQTRERGAFSRRELEEAGRRREARQLDIRAGAGCHGTGCRASSNPHGDVRHGDVRYRTPCAAGEQRDNPFVGAGAAANCAADSPGAGSATRADPVTDQRADNFRCNQL